MLAKTMEGLGLAKGTRFAVGCSGGGDSMALTLMAAQWCAKEGMTLTALTVDHAIRPEAAAEARQAKAWLTARGIKHVTLTWEGVKPKSNIQQAARKIRYALISEYCRAQGIKYLLIAHHREDQAETFLLRLARGSGVDGLAAMQPVSERGGLNIIRPLLNVPKAELMAYLKAQKQEHIDDISNLNRAYNRVRIRSAMPMLAELGLTVERLVATADNMARARASLEAEAAEVMARICVFFPEGYALLRRFEASGEITLRVLASLIMAVGGHEVRPRLEDLERLRARIMLDDFKGATLGGCQFIAKGNIIVCREPRAVAGPVPAAKGVWDNRYRIECTPSKGWTVGALTQAGWLSLAKEHSMSNPYPDKKILYTLPALRDEKGTIKHIAFLDAFISSPYPSKEREFKAVFTALRQYPGSVLADR